MILEERNIECEALICEVHALNISVMAMKVANSQDKIKNKELSYDETDFRICADKMRDFVTKLRQLNSNNIKKHSKCTCQKDKNINHYEYIIKDKYQGFTDDDNYCFTPKYCPWCGKRNNQ